VNAAWQDAARRLAHACRQRTFAVAVARNGAYLGQACSSAEILAVLHARFLDREQDALVLSPAHYALAQFAVLAELGEIPAEDLAAYGDDGARLEMIPGGGAPGMLFTTGSLAQGLSLGIGLALGRRQLGTPGRVVVFVSDGELEEGQTWEALACAAHHRLESLTVVLDLNGSQVDGDPAEILGIEPVLDRLLAFGLDAIEVDGHDLDAIAAALEAPRDGRPRAVACRTRIWQGIPSLQERHNLHFVRFREGEAELAAAELAAGAPA